MNLARALSFSRYAQRTLLARPALPDELIATLDAPFDWTKAAADIDAAAAGSDDACSPRRCACCAGACSSTRWRAT